MYKGSDMPASQSGPSARLSSIPLHLTFRHSPRTHFIPRPARRQSRSRHTLYAVRYALGGRGHAIINWQCTVPHNQLTNNNVTAQMRETTTS